MSAIDTGGGYVNPYHQAWAAQSQADNKLNLVQDWGVAHIVMGGDSVVDMYDYQHNQKQFPPNFFKKDPQTGKQRRFTCLVCNVSLFDENLIRSHCSSAEHHNRLSDPRRDRASVSIKKKSVDKRKLPIVLDLSDEPAVGLENVVEWWPYNDQRESNFPIYTCQICDGFVGWGGDAAKHVTGEKHRRKQLVTRYPVLEEMIKDMDLAELKERCKEEERKHQRRYEVIQVVTDLESYQEFYQQLEGHPFKVMTPQIPMRGHQPPTPGHPSHRGINSQQSFSGPPPNLHMMPPPVRGNIGGPFGHGPERGGFMHNNRGNFGPPGRVQPPFRGHPPPRGHLPPGPCRLPPPGGPGPLNIPPPLNVPPPMNLPPPTNVPPPMNFPPPPPQPPIPSHRGRFGADRGRGHIGPDRGRGHNGPMRGGPGMGRGWHPNPHEPPLHHDQFNHPQSGRPDNFHSGYDSDLHFPHGHRREDEYVDAEYNEVDRRSDNRMMRDPYREDDVQHRLDESERAPIKKRRVAPPEHMFEDDDHEYKHRSQERVRVAPPEDYFREEDEYNQDHSRGRERRSVIRREGRRSRRRDNRRLEENEEDLPEACYAVSADQEELDTENNAKDVFDYGRVERRKRMPDLYRGRDREYSSVARHERYDSKVKKRKEVEKEETPYEGPTIFDKVFRTKKKSDEDLERQERERDLEMEKEWRKYKEETKARIRREKEKLHKYEKKLKELEASTSNAEMTLKEAELKNSKRKRSEAHYSLSPRGSSPPAAYGGRSSAWSSSESDNEKESYSQTAMKPSSHSSPELSKSPVSTERDKCQAKFDPY